MQIVVHIRTLPNGAVLVCVCALVHLMYETFKSEILLYTPSQWNLIIRNNGKCSLSL